MTVHVFAGYDYYPCGGTRDHINSFDTLPEAVEWVKVECKKYDWWHICDAETLVILAED